MWVRNVASEYLIVRIESVNGIVEYAGFDEGVGREVLLTDVLFELIKHREMAGKVVLCNSVRESHDCCDIVVIDLPRPFGRIQHVEESRLMLRPSAVDYVASGCSGMKKLTIRCCGAWHRTEPRIAKRVFSCQCAAEKNSVSEADDPKVTRDIPQHRELCRRIGMHDLVMFVVIQFVRISPFAAPALVPRKESAHIRLHAFKGG